MQGSRYCHGAARRRNLTDWEELGIVLRQHHHLSYPFVFEHDGQVYIVPDPSPSNVSICIGLSSFRCGCKAQRVDCY